MGRVSELALELDQLPHPDQEHPQMSRVIHRHTDAIHSIVDRAEEGLKLFLDKIDATHDSGWSPETLPVIHLQNDERTLLKLADRIRETRMKLIGRVALVAAE